MTNTTYLQAADLKVTINYLTDVKTELANASTQAVVVLKKRKQPNPAPAALTTALDAVETNLVGPFNRTT